MMVVHQWREVTILRAVVLGRTFFCLVGPERLRADVRQLIQDFDRIVSSPWFPQWRTLRALRKLGRTWDESSPDERWSEQLASAISRSRDLLETIDLAGVAPLEPRIRDEYDDIIFAVMAKIVTDDPTPLHPWVEMVYGMEPGAFDETPIRSALAKVEVELRGARYS